MKDSFRNIPQEERPRERLVREGTSALSLIELVAIILGSGNKEANVMEVASQLVMRSGGLEGLLQMTLTELMQIKGIGRVRAIQLQAVLGVARLSKQLRVNEKMVIGSASDVYHLSRVDLAMLSQEALLVVLRDAKGHFLHQEIIGKGTLSQVLVHPREVFHLAIRHLAASLIVVHNHPSGDPTPSEADIQLTRTLIEAGKLLSLQVDDHVIVSKERYVSLRELGFFPHLTCVY
jgi:DNA repair protein RadC